MIAKSLCFTFQWR